MSWLSKFRRTPLGGIAEMIIRQKALAAANKKTGGKLSEVAEVILDNNINGSAEKREIGNIFGIRGGNILDD